MKIATQYVHIKDDSGFGTRHKVELERPGLAAPLDVFTEWAHEQGYLTQVDLQPTTDVIEIDAASHGGVDQIRQLLAQIQYAPAAPPTFDQCLAAGKEFYIFEGWAPLEELA